MTIEEKRQMAEQFHQRGCDFRYGRNDISQNLREAAIWFTKAIKTNDDIASMIELGGLYLIQNKFDAAYYWFLEAALTGSAAGICNLGVMYDSGRYVPTDYKKAYEYFLEAYRRGNTGACYFLGQYALFGRYGVHNTGVAAKYFQEGADKGNVQCAANLGFIYQTGGPGLPRDLKKAFDLYLFAAKNGDGTACHNLGLMYEKGEAIEQNLHKAIEWYSKGAQRGEKSCIRQLNRLKRQGVQQ